MEEVLIKIVEVILDFRIKILDFKNQDWTYSKF